MKLNPKKYIAIKTKKYLKTNKLFFFFNGINQSHHNWIKTEQELATKKIDYYKVFNKISDRTLKISIYKNIKPAVSSITFFLKKTTNTKTMKSVLLDNDSFIFLALKMNFNIYSVSQMNFANSLIYKTNNLLLYQFLLTNSKKFFFRSSAI